MTRARIDESITPEAARAVLALFWDELDALSNHEIETRRTLSGAEELDSERLLRDVWIGVVAALHARTREGDATAATLPMPRDLCAAAHRRARKVGILP